MYVTHFLCQWWDLQDLNFCGPTAQDIAISLICDAYLNSYQVNIHVWVCLKIIYIYIYSSNSNVNGKYHDCIPISNLSWKLTMIEAFQFQRLQLQGRRHLGSGKAHCRFFFQILVPHLNMVDFVRFIHTYVCMSVCTYVRR